MKLCFVSACLLGSTVYAMAAYQQQLVPIVREITISSAPSVSEWRTFVRMADYGGTSYVSLVQIAELLNGHLRWRPVTQGVDLSVHNQTIRFGDNSAHAWINGRKSPLDHPTVKNEDGFWVPTSFFASPGFFHATKTKLDWPPTSTSSSAGSGVPFPSSSRQGQSPVGDAGSKTHLKTTDAKMDSPPTTAGNDDKKMITLSHSTHAIRRIVIDPGHGGKDPGAVGPHGVEEKAINLQLAQELADVLRDDHDYEVLLTRMDDTFIPLEERARLANRHNADLFISIHCNASLSSKLKGFEVYFLSEEASDPHADAVARLENAPLALEGKKAPTPRQVNAVLRSLVKNANINEASALGSLMDRHLAERLSEPSLGVKQAAFYVLRGAEMPALLIETGFISNAQEEKLLQDKAFRKKLIEGIAAADYRLRPTETKGARMSNALPIGLFDSGVGGLTVLREVAKQLPQESTVYFGDTARVPYGSKSRDVISRFSFEIAQFLLQEKVKMIVVACNTASAFALSALQNRFAVPIIGVIEPGAQAALGATKTGRVGVIGTEGTIESLAYSEAIHRLKAETQVFGQACPLIVPLVEEGWLDKPVALEIVKEYLVPLLTNKIDTLVLGCTHYPLLKNLLAQVVGSQVRLIDSAEETTRSVGRKLKDLNLEAPSASPVLRRFFVSDAPEKFEKIGQRFLGQAIPGVKRVDISQWL